MQRLARGAAATVLSAALVLGAAAPTFAEPAAAPDATATPVFLPSPGDLFGGGGDEDKLLTLEEARAQLSPEERATVSIFDRNTPSVVNIANLASYSRRCAAISFNRRLASRASQSCSSSAVTPVGASPLAHLLARAAVRRHACASALALHNCHPRCSPFSMDVTTIPQGTGSGFIWDDRGHVVTNYHVVKGASGLKVTLIDSTSCSASIVGIDETKDIAVLKLDIPERQARRLQTVELGRSAALAVGQRVFAIGNPFGLDHTLTSVRACACVQADLLLRFRALCFYVLRILNN